MWVLTGQAREEPAAESFGVLDGAEAFGELRLVFAGLEEASEKGLSLDV